MSSSGDPAPIRVLHVDDDPSLLDLATTFLEREGGNLEAETATSAEEGLDCLTEANSPDGLGIDCVVSDYDMPGMDGLEFLEAVRETHSDLPFILFTGKGSEEIASEAITAGVTDYLNKGSGTDQYTLLANRIENAASQYRTEYELRRSTDRLERLYGGLTDAIFALNADWEFTHLNSRAEELLDRTEGELVGENVWEQFPVMADTTFQHEYERAMNQHEPVEFETLHPLFDTWVEVRAVPIEDRLTVHFRDISEKREREHELERQTDLLERTQQIANVGGWELDLNDDGLRWTDEVHRIHGVPLDYDPDLEEGIDFYHPEDAPVIEDAVERAIEAGESFDEELRLIRSDGTQRWVRAQGEPRQEDGETVLLRGVMQDITERKEREAERDRARARFRSLFEHLPDPAAIAETRDGEPILQEVNRAFETVFGYSAETGVGKSVDDLIVPPGREAEAKQLDRKMNRNEQVEAELQRQTATGELRDFLFRNVPIESESEGTSFGIYTDMTERTEREERLESRLSALETSMDGMAILDADGRYTYVNAAHAEIYGYDDPNAFVGEHWQMRYGDAELELFEEEVMPVLEAEGQWRGEATGKRRDGTKFPQELTLTALNDGGLVCVVRDITERKAREREIEEQNEKMEALHAVTTDLVSCRTRDEICELMVDAAERILDHDLCYVGIVEGDSIIPRARSANAGPEYVQTMGVDEGVAGKTLQTGTSYLIEDTAAATDAEPAQEDYRSAISAPIGDRGVFQAVSKEVGGFNESDRELAETLLATVRATLERVEREEQLREREAQLQHERNSLAALFENVPDPMYRHSRDGDAVIPEAVNPAFERVFGYDEETVVGRPITETIVPPDRIEEHEDLAASSNAGESLDAEVERLTTDGRRTFRLHNAPIEGPTGDRSEEYAIYTDITERRKNETYRRRLYEITADTELATDETIQRVLEFGCEYFDMESGFLTHIEDDTQRIVRASSPHEAIQQGSECPLSEAYCRKTIEMDEPLTVAHAAASGWEDDPAYERFGLEAYVGAKLTIEGERYGTVCFADRSPRESGFSELERSFVDLVVRGIESTLERHKYETELERQNDQLGEFAGVISHDLRNPLTVADGYLDLASETGDDEYFTKVENAHDRMDAIIEDVLTLTRQGERIAETSRVELGVVARDAWENVATDGADLVMADDLGEVDADEGRFMQLFENLYRNAIEHAGETPTVRVGRYPAGFYVEDDGPGIPENEREKVFDSGYTTGEEGTGMGLSIVDTIATAHGWGVGIGDGIDGGARFKMQLGMTRGGFDDLLLSD